MTVDQVLELLDSNFGRKTNPDVLMQDLYRIVQEPKQKLSIFGIRLKVALDRILVFHPESLNKDQAAKQLRDNFYYGIRQNVTEGLRYYYDVIQADYTALLTKHRSIEAEKSNVASGTPAIAKSVASVKSDKDLGIENLSKTMSELITIVKVQQEKSSIMQNGEMIEKVQMEIRMEGIKGDQTLMLLDPLEMELLPYNAISVGDVVRNLQCVLLI